MRSMFAAAVAAVCINYAFAVDRSKFKTCKDSGFCRRHRDVDAEPAWRIAEGKFDVSPDQARATARLVGGPSGAPPLSLFMRFLESGAVRTKIIEDDGREPRWENHDVVLEEHAGTKASNVAAAQPSTPAVGTAAGPGQRLPTEGHSYVTFQGNDGATRLVMVRHDPFRIDVFMDGQHHATVNGRGKFYLEHRRERDAAAAAAAATANAAAQQGSSSPGGRKILDWGEDGKAIYADAEEGDAEAEGTAADPSTADAVAPPAVEEGDGYWEESFKEHRDSKPHGPMSVGVDVQFPSRVHLYGIPEHADSFDLRGTRGEGSEGPLSSQPGQQPHSEPYRLYNLDVFEYELMNPMALYGAIPFMVAHAGSHSTGVFWHNPTETFIDVEKNGAAAAAGTFGRPGASRVPGSSTRWMSESGVFDLTIFAAGAPKAVVSQFTALVGAQELPAKFALGYHQCRWNYRDEADVYQVDSKFEEHDFPYDVLWLDIEHTDGKRYFTWDKAMFPNPVQMQEKLAARGRKMVTIVDPHIKKDTGYPVYNDARQKGYYVRQKDGKEDFDGWCWPGSSAYLDFTSPVVRDYWSDQFAVDRYEGSTKHLYTWNDMNEMSVFNGPEVTMQKDTRAIDGTEHREWHNLYGFYQHWATAEGHRRREADGNTRPFVLSRAFFAGTQRHGAIWTGDNLAKWEHLQASVPMLLSIGTAGLAFAGADVGGFFENPDSELMIRWYQAGAHQPFFRAHAHLDTKRREPWLFGDEVLGQLRGAVRERYALLPYWYSVFAEAEREGTPVMRPMFMEFPGEEGLFGEQSQWMGGGALLVRPVMEQGATSASVVFPGGSRWYGFREGHRGLVHSGAASATKQVDAPLDVIPVFQRGGTVVPRQERPRRCTAMMSRDPYTLVVALDDTGSASGDLYSDDGISYDHARKAAFQRRTFAVSSSGGRMTIESRLAGGSAGWKGEGNKVERIVVAGVTAAPSAVVVRGGGGAVEFEHDAGQGVLTLKRVGLGAFEDWAIDVSA